MASPTTGPYEEGNLLADVIDGVAKAANTGNVRVDEAVKALLQTGKLLRPQFVLAIGSCFPRADHRDLVAAGTAVELLHLASLVHDDVLDGAESRRGVPTLHAAVGMPRSILAADLLIARAMSQAAHCGAAVVAECAAAFAELNVGQLAEYDLEPAGGETALLDYMANKTAALFRASCRVGAICAGATPEQTEHVGRFGWHFGMMFQMADDLLDIVGDEQRLGKPAHQDLGNGIFTIAALRQLSIAPDELRQAVSRQDYAAAYALIASGEPLEYAREMARRQSVDAIASLDAAALAAPAVDALRRYTAGYVDSALAAGSSPGSR